jgi:excisionase family DNA binding protein
MLGSKLLLSLKEVSHLVGLSLRTTTKLIATGEIKSIRVGRRRLVPRDELVRFARRDHSTIRQRKPVHGKQVGR